jgi:hypothetical protein
VVLPLSSSLYYAPWNHQNAKVWFHFQRFASHIFLLTFVFPAPFLLVAKLCGDVQTAKPILSSLDPDLVLLALILSWMTPVCVNDEKA